MTIAAAIDDALFKRVGNGWVYRAPNPWIFGDAPHYLVDDAQKAELSGLLTPRHPYRFGLLVALGLIAWVFAIAGFMWLIGLDADKASAGEFALMITITITGLLLALPLIAKVQLWRLRAVLSVAPLTACRITYREIAAATRHTYSRNKALALAGVWAFSGLMQLLTLGIRNARHPLFSDGQSFIQVVGVIAAAIVMAKFLLIAKRAVR